MILARRRTPVDTPHLYPHRGRHMPRSTSDAPITTRAARERLTARREPYWRGIESGIAVGYRRNANGGAWLARVLEDGRYREQGLGRADDALPANGADILDFRQ